MPNRTEIERQNIDALPVKEPGNKCNARLPTGRYCKMAAGTKTDHPGEGRCFLHGGCAGRPIEHGLYSKKLTKTMAEDYEAIVTDPGFRDLHTELAATKTVFAGVLQDIADRVNSGENPWVCLNRHDEEVISPQATLLLKTADTISKLYQRIVEAEDKAKHNLNIKQIQNVLIQIKVGMGETCGMCPIRNEVGNRIRNIKFEPVQQLES